MSHHLLALTLHKCRENTGQMSKTSTNPDDNDPIAKSLVDVKDRNSYRNFDTMFLTVSIIRWIISIAAYYKLWGLFGLSLWVDGLLMSIVTNRK